MLAPSKVFSGFSVTDLEEAKTFYTKVLGFKTKSQNMGLQLELPHGSELFVYQKEDHEPATYTVLNLVVADIDQALEELKASGVEFEVYDNLPAPQDDTGVLRGLMAGEGPDIAWFKDPAGNILSILQDQ